MRPSGPPAQHHGRTDLKSAFAQIAWRERPRSTSFPRSGRPRSRRRRAEPNAESTRSVTRRRRFSLYFRPLCASGHPAIAAACGGGSAWVPARRCGIWAASWRGAPEGPGRSRMSTRPRLLRLSSDADHSVAIRSCWHG